MTRMALVLVVGAVAAGAPPAHAAPTYDCRLYEVPAGTRHEAYATGSVAHPDGNVSIRCYVTVDGTEVASTPRMTGTFTAYTSGPVSHDTRPGAVELICAEATDPHSSVVTCDPVVLSPTGPPLRGPSQE